MTDAGTLLITTLTDVDDFDLEKLNRLSAPNELFVVNMGENNFDQYPIDLALPYRPDTNEAADIIIAELKDSGVILR